MTQQISDLQADPALAPIVQIVGEKGVIVGDDQTPLLTEWRQRWHGSAEMIVAPQNRDELCAIVKHCAAKKIAITPQGGNTGLVGGQIPTGHEILISTKRMRTIESVSVIDNTMTVEAGVTLQEAQSAALEADRFFPLSIGSEGSCQIGGAISTNAGGVNVLRYGNMRDLVLGLEAVLPNGEIWNGLHSLRKNNTGYDLKHLFIGGEGTLGIVTRAVLKLFARPHQTETVFIGAASADAIIALLPRLQGGSGGLVSSFELIDEMCINLVLRHIPNTRLPLAQTYPFYGLIEFSAGHGAHLKPLVETLLAGAIEEGLTSDVAVASNETQRDDFWRLRHHVSQALNGEGVGARHDVSVPISAIPQFLQTAARAIQQVAPAARIAAFGHVGDGNIHYDIIPPEGASKTALDDQRPAIEAAVYDVIAQFGGSISAEHGIGTHKKEILAKHKDSVELAMMHAVKTAIDPHNIMNPGKMLVLPNQR